MTRMPAPTPRITTNSEIWISTSGLPPASMKPPRVEARTMKAPTRMSI
jgi:hypothetical protein